MNRKRRTIRPLQTIQTLRCRFTNRAGVPMKPNGRLIFDVGNNPNGRERFLAMQKALAAWSFFYIKAKFTHTRAAFGAYWRA